MKFVMSLVLAATIATPAFAADKEVKTVEAKNRNDIQTVVDAAQEKNAEEERGDKAYRLEDLQDPNQQTASTSEKTVEIRPWFPSVRKLRMTTAEREQEAMYCAGKPPGCKDVTRIATEPGGISAGGTIRIKFGGARQ